MPDRNNHPTRAKKYRVRLRFYATAVSIFTICTSCTISLVLVILGARLLYHGEFTPLVALVMCAATCFLAMFLASFAIYHVAGHFVEPIETVSHAVKEIASGAFDTQIPPLAGDRKEARFLHELDELQFNVNQMAYELSGMDHMRKDFINNVSHEMKTPVSAIMGFAEMLQENDINDAERREYLDLLYDESRRVSRLCENMLRISRLENQTILTGIQPVRIDEQIRKAIILLSENQPARTFDVDLPAITLDTDRDLLQEVWINLIDNAMKYSAENTIIHVSATVLSDEVQVTIRDEGIGIPPEKQDHIFEMFYQCEESHKKTGNGLGLPIVRRILDLLGGSINCRSHEGAGTEMTVHLSR